MNQKPEPIKSKWTILREYLMILIALFPFALMVNWVFLPHQIVGGGLTGICSIIYYATSGMFPTIFAEYGGSVPVWLTTLIINTILLTVAVMTVGWRFCVRTLWGVLVLAFWYWLIPVRQEAMIEDPLLGCIVGGVVFGGCLGVVMMNNGSSGGTDIIAMIVNHYKDISLGRVMVFCDILIILSAYILPVSDSITDPSAIVDYRIKRVMYGMSLTVTYTASLDWLMSRLRQSVQFFIYTRNHAEIATAINKTVNRGVTVLDGTGWYSQQPMKVVSVLTRKHESKQVMDIVNAIDPNAFVSVANVTGVFGAGFDQIKKN